MDTNTMTNVVETAVENKEIISEAVKEGIKASKIAPYVVAGVVVIGASYMVVKKIKDKSTVPQIEGEVADVIEPKEHKHFIFKKKAGKNVEVVEVEDEDETEENK